MNWLSWFISEDTAFLIREIFKAIGLWFVFMSLVLITGFIFGPGMGIIAAIMIGVGYIRENSR